MYSVQTLHLAEQSSDSPERKPDANPYTTVWIRVRFVYRKLLFSSRALLFTGRARQKSHRGKAHQALEVCLRRVTETYMEGGDRDFVLRFGFRHRAASCAPTKIQADSISAFSR